MAERQFGPYRLVRQVAVGGMAEIHLAKTKGIAGFEKYVAVKMIHPNFAEDEQFIQMLVDEAKIAVQLTHGNIAQTFDLGRVGQTYYITMEYIDGADLYKLLRKGSEVDLEMPLDICAFVGKEVAAALDYAHRKKDVGGKPLGIVHRDVSPQNVLVSYAGEVKLVDFGIAKATSKARQTAIGVIKGKYYYMSPEQAWGDPIDYRSDIFSAGIVLYEMITGQMLYLEEDLHKLLDMARKADIAPPSTLRPGIPPQLERIVMHALAKVPGERYQSAGDLATDLERFLHAYSPVFTAAKLSSVLRNVVGDPPQIPADELDAQMEMRDGPLSTQPLPADAVAHAKEEIRDENSVIFRMSDLDKSGNVQRGARPTPPAGAPKVATPPAGRPAVAPGAPRSPTKPTGPMPSLAGKPPTGKIPSIAKPPAAVAPMRPAAPLIAPVKPRAPARPRQLDEETRELGPAPGDPDHAENEPSGLLTLEPSAAARGPRPAAKTAQRVAVPASAAPPTAVRAWADSAVTQSIEDDLENIGERTQITKPAAAGSATDLSDDEVDYASGPDATMITKAPRPATGPDDGDLDDQTHPGLGEDDDDDGGDEAALAAAIDAAIQKDRRSSHDTASRDQADDDDDAPTLGGGRDLLPDEDGPTMQRDFRDGHDATARAGSSPDGSDPLGSAPAGAKPRAPRTARSAAVAPPALAAKIHTPAVSELRKPRPSRRTPPGGVASQSSVLQAIVGAQTSEPMPTPRPMPVAQPPPPQPPPAPAYPSPPPPMAYQPPPGYPSPAGAPAAYGYPPPQTPVQGYAPPGSYPSGASPYESPPPYPGDPTAPPFGAAAGGGGAHPGDPNAPSGQYASPGALYAYQPFGVQPMPPTLTGQLRLTEGDELPAHLQLRGGKRWLVLVMAGLLAVSAAATATYFLLRATRETPPTIGSIRVESTPAGAQIFIDGQTVAGVTPFTIPDVPVGSRHEIKLTLAHYVSDSKTVDVPPGGGETEVSAFLQTVKGSLKISSTPSGAEIRLDNQNKGLTPRTINDVDMSSAKHLDLRLKDYQVFTKDLSWPESGEIVIEAKLVK